MQKIQLDLTSHPVKNLLSENVRLGKIEIIRDPQSAEEQISIDFSISRPASKKTTIPGRAVVAAPVFHH